jgi:hypothetical protein
MSDMRQDDRVSTVTFTLPAGHQWTTVEAALREAHDQEYELRMAFFWRCQYLEAKVAALTKAGDAMVPLLGRGDYDNARIDWNAAKEGEAR